MRLKVLTGFLVLLLCIGTARAQEYEIHSDRNWCRFVNAGTHFEDGKGRRCDKWVPAQNYENGAVVPQCETWVADENHFNDYLVNSVRIFRGRCNHWSVIQTSTWVSIRCDDTWHGSIPKRSIDAPPPLPSLIDTTDSSPKIKREDPNYFKDAMDQDKWYGEPGSFGGHREDWFSWQPFAQDMDEVGFFDDHKEPHDPFALGSADEWIDWDYDSPPPDASPTTSAATSTETGSSDTESAASPTATWPPRTCVATVTGALFLSESECQDLNPDWDLLPQPDRDNPLNWKRSNSIEMPPSQDDEPEDNEPANDDESPVKRANSLGIWHDRMLKWAGGKVPNIVAPDHGKRSHSIEGLTLQDEEAMDSEHDKRQLLPMPFPMPFIPGRFGTVASSSTSSAASLPSTFSTRVRRAEATEMAADFLEVGLGPA